MKFNTPCFVRVEDAEKRKELIEWAKELGYGLLLSDGLAGEYYLSADSNRIIWSNRHCHGYDCDTNIDLFKALAAMNDENDYMQWFVDMNDVWYEEWMLSTEQCLGEIIFQTTTGESDYRSQYRKATAEEIIEHFRAKQP